MGTDFDNHLGAMGLHDSEMNWEYAFASEPGAPGERDKEVDPEGEAPETPLDEPRPPRVQDPPPQPDQKGPYVVQTQCR